MHRRRYLSLAAVGLGTAIAGCTAGDGGSPPTTEPDSARITGEDPTVEPGGSVEIRITATAVTGLHLGVPIDEPDVEFSVRTEHVTPAPDRQLDVYPPKWEWDQCTDVEVALPVAVADDAEPGAYTYAVTATPCEATRDRVDREFTLTVAGG